MLTFWSSTARPLSLGLLRGGFDREQIIAEIDRAYRDGDLKRGQDRVIHLDDVPDNDLIAVSDLSDIQQRVARQELRNSGGVPYKAVFLAKPSLTAVTLDIYSLLWQVHSDFHPHFYQVQGLSTAEVILGCAGLSREYATQV